MKTKCFLFLLLCVSVIFVIPACNSLDETQTDRYLDSVTVAERQYVDAKAGKATPTDNVKYLELNFRAWVAWGVELGALSEESAKALLAEHGITNNLGQPAPTPVPAPAPGAPDTR